MNLRKISENYKKFINSIRIAVFYLHINT